MITMSSVAMEDLNTTAHPAPVSLSPLLLRDIPNVITLCGNEVGGDDDDRGCLRMEGRGRRRDPLPPPVASSRCISTNKEAAMPVHATPLPPNLLYHRINDSIAPVPPVTSATRGIEQQKIPKLYKHIYPAV
ncbi:unnamed protein product [Pleuronectes platessa]|uniref:Uncharacterized protein n=1 Tax=Pleuronectes platessa TaxID=8262 RepID=A0A9N7VT54_PLEPL|nr:unnamed protein product [Pleuronectes platessa]